MSELGPVEREAELAKLRKRVRKAGRGGDRKEFERLSAEYAERKAEHVTLSHAEMKAAMRARRAAARAERAQERAEQWKLPRGFGTSPMAAQRAREGRPGGGPQVPSGGLRPWREEWGSMGSVIWRP
jgi:hypothetical protein